jgi:hypothetical protein
MDKMYTILWIDDQFEELQDFSIQAENSGINLIGYSSYEEGFEQLEKNLSFFDGVLLDGLFFEKKGQVPGEEDEAGLGKALARLNQLKYRKDLPWFMLSGKDSFTKESNSLLKADRKECFDKTNGDDIDKLFLAIKKEADALDDTQVKHRYQRIFSVCTDKYIGEGAADPLLTILKSFSKPEAEIQDEVYFNPLRVVLEKMFRAANKYGLLHDRCIKGGDVVLKNSFKFLSQQEVKVAENVMVFCIEKHFPVLIERAVKNILEVTNVASHSESSDKEKSHLELTAYRQTVRSPYLLYSLTFQLMDILLWFKRYVDEHNNYEANVALWKDIPISTEAMYTGKLEQDDDGNYFCGIYLLNYNYTKENYSLGEEIAILEATVNNNSRTQQRYTHFANKFKRVEIS